MEAIPTAVCLTTYDGGVRDFMAMPMQSLIDQVGAGERKVTVGRAFRLGDIVEAHRTIETNQAREKIVVLTN